MDGGGVFSRSLRLRLCFPFASIVDLRFFSSRVANIHRHFYFLGLGSDGGTRAYTRGLFREHLEKCIFIAHAIRLCFSQLT